MATQHHQEVQELTVKYEYALFHGGPADHRASVHPCPAVATHTQRRAATAEQEVEKLKEYILSLEQQHQLEIQKINEQLE